MYKLLALATMALQIFSLPLDQAESSTPTLQPRQFFSQNIGQNCPYSRIVSGAKGQSYQHWQVTDNFSCEGATCSAAKLKEHTFGISASGDLSGTIGGLGVGVTSEWTSGEEYTCQGTPGQKVCVWVKMAFTRYDLGTAKGCQNHATVEGKIPNEDNAGGEYYCGTGGDCQEIDANFWE